MGLVRLVEGVINIFLEPVTCISYFTLEEEKLQNMYYVPNKVNKNMRQFGVAHKI